MERGLIRPASVAKPAIALLLVTAALFGIAKTTGSGWLVVTLAFIVSVATLAATLPAIGLAGVVASIELPRDATVGHPLRARIAISGRRRPLTIRVTGWATMDCAAVDVPGEGVAEIVPLSRGVHDRVVLDVRCGAPLGLVWWRRRVTVTLARSVEVGPWPADVAVPAPTGMSVAGYESRSAPHAGDDLTRGARPYRPGDPIKTMHWAATARQGVLMVRETEAAAAPPLTVIADLHGSQAEVEAAAAAAAGVAVGALERGMGVVLVTRERLGVVVESVATRLEVNRRMARAVSGPVDERLVPATAGGAVRVDARGVRP